MITKFKVPEKFKNFLNIKTRFQFLMGSYGSGKSYNAHIKEITLCQQMPGYKVAIIRKTRSSHKNSTFSKIKKMTENIVVVKSKETTDIVFPNGSQIWFMGCDSTEKLKSLDDVDFIHLEELTEFEKEDFEELKARQRGVKEPQFLMTTNPLSHSHWFYKLFFEQAGITPKEFYNNEFIHEFDALGEVYYNHSDVYDNPNVSDQYIMDLEKLKFTNFFKYVTGCLGHFGVIGDKVLERVYVEPFEDVIREAFGGIVKNGLDFGFSVSANCALRFAIRSDTIYITHEYHQKDPRSEVLAANLKKHYANIGEQPSCIWGDHAHPDPINTLQTRGLPVQPCQKLTIVEQIDRLKDYKIVVADTCVNAANDLDTLTYLEKKGVKYPDLFSFDSHVLSALFYGLSYTSRIDYKGGEVTQIKF